TSVAFGNVNVGSSKAQTLTLTNSGTASLTISQATVSGTGYSISGLTLPLTLAAGQTTPLSAAFAPSAAGSTTGRISLVRNATNSPASEPLSGTGIHAVKLSWGASTSTNVVGYNVYRGAASGGPFTLLNPALVAGTAYADTTVQAGQTYYYVTTAVDSSNAQS